MPISHLLFYVLLSVQNVFASVDPAFQKQIDQAFQEIMQTHMGKEICQRILGADPDAIAFHLGVSNEAAHSIAADCSEASVSEWVYATPYQDIRKLTLSTPGPRAFTLLAAETAFPIESWTEPFTNTTVLLADRNGLSHERLVQLLAHEMAVYFDSKANPAHRDAQKLPQLRDMDLRTTAKMNPLAAISNPLTAHTLTYIRALQVEFSIVNELIEAGKIKPPSDHDDPYLNYLISDRCKDKCLQQLILNMRQSYLPIGLAFIAFAPQYRSVLTDEVLSRSSPNWSQEQWARFQGTLDSSGNFITAQSSGNPTADLQRVFMSDEKSRPSFNQANIFLRDDLWPLEWPALTETQVGSTTLLEFMKIPLLSGYNILFSSGPRVRVRTGNVE